MVDFIKFIIATGCEGCNGCRISGLLLHIKLTKYELYIIINIEIHINMVDFIKFIIATGCEGYNGCTVHYAGILVVVKVVRVVQYV